MKVYDVRTIGFIAGSSPIPITATVPDVMVGVVSYVRYALGNQNSTITVYLLQSRLGTITGTLDVVTLSPAMPTVPIDAGGLDDIVAVVDPGHQVVAMTNTGSVIGKILFGYSYGRVRRP